MDNVIYHVIMFVFVFLLGVRWGADSRWGVLMCATFGALGERDILSGLGPLSLWGRVVFVHFCWLFFTQPSTQQSHNWGPLANISPLFWVT
jgi:hypothetical protein